jgi:hypothetical protein
MGGWVDGWMGGWVRGEYRFSSPLKKKIKTKKIASSFTAPEFFFKKIYVMKCLRSKKRLKSPVITTPGRATGI